MASRIRYAVHKVEAVPVIVVVADTVAGRAIVEGLVEPGREVRAFVTDVGIAAELRGRGVKVALGDVSDDSHVEGAATSCFTAVLVTDAADDDRERSFATSRGQVLQGWARAVAASGVTRVIWVGEGEVAPTSTRESVQVSSTLPDLVQEVVELDSARSLG
jgi:putative NADH-flavin reductase